MSAKLIIPNAAKVAPDPLQAKSTMLELCRENARLIDRDIANGKCQCDGLTDSIWLELDKQSELYTRALELRNSSRTHSSRRIVYGRPKQ